MGCKIGLFVVTRLGQVVGVLGWVEWPAAANTRQQMQRVTEEHDGDVND